MLILHNYGWMDVIDSLHHIQYFRRSLLSSCGNTYISMVTLTFLIGGLLFEVIDWKLDPAV